MTFWIILAVYVVGFVHVGRRMVRPLAKGVHVTDCINPGYLYSANHDKDKCGLNPYAWFGGTILAIAVGLGWPIYLFSRYAGWLIQSMAQSLNNRGINAHHIFPDGFKELETIPERRARRLKDAEHEVKTLRAKLSEKVSA